MAMGGEIPSDKRDSKWNCQVDSPLFAMRFAEDLINYVWRKADLKWPPGYTAYCRMKNVVFQEVFLSAVGEAVFQLIGFNIKRISSSYQDLTERGIDNKDDFRREVCMTAALYFYDGYDHERFLIFCSSLVGVSIFYFENGNLEIANASAEILSYILNFYIYQCVFQPAEDWFNLALAAQDIRRALLKGDLTFRTMFPEQGERLVV